MKTSLHFEGKLVAPVDHSVDSVVSQCGNMFNFLLIVPAPQQELSQSDCFYVELMKYDCIMRQCNKYINLYKSKHVNSS